ncbi:MAG: class I SAM-dependent methyltransferase [Pseudomonadota bacterium]
MEDFYASLNLNVESYESLCEPPPREIAGDIAFYVDTARRFGGPVLELACGTGRVARGLAEAGFDVWGVDASPAMLALAKTLVAENAPSLSDRITFVEGRLETFNLDERFPLSVIAYRSFLLLLTPEDQMASLARMADHLAPGGGVVLHIFDPRLEYLTGQQDLPNSEREGRSIVTGNIVRKSLLKADLDLMTQVRRDVWRHEEFDQNGKMCRREDLELAIRWTYRHEFAHLIAHAGFEIEAEFSDFEGAPPAYGGERVIVLRRA